MLTTLEKLLVLQERDRQLARLREELEVLPPQRAATQARLEAARQTVEAVRQRGLHLEAERKKLELEVESRQQLIQKYSLQQFQTKRNEEYRALTHEIETCKADITRLEDQQLELMEQQEQTQQELARRRRELEEIQRETDRVLADLAAREQHLRQQWNELSAGRDALAAEVEPGLLSRYERLRRNKGPRVVVGVEHGACGGCHVGLPAQVVIACRAQQEELAQCPNCGRILYYTPDMDLVRAE